MISIKTSWSDKKINSNESNSSVVLDGGQYFNFFQPHTLNYLMKIGLINARNNVHVEHKNSGIYISKSFNNVSFILSFRTKLNNFRKNSCDSTKRKKKSLKTFNKSCHCMHSSKKQKRTQKVKSRNKKVSLNFQTSNQNAENELIKMLINAICQQINVNFDLYSYQYQCCPKK